MSSGAPSRMMDTDRLSAPAARTVRVRRAHRIKSGVRRRFIGSSFLWGVFYPILTDLPRDAQGVISGRPGKSVFTAADGAFRDLCRGERCSPLQEAAFFGKLFPRPFCGKRCPGRGDAAEGGLWQSLWKGAAESGFVKLFVKISKAGSYSFGG